MGFKNRILHMQPIARQNPGDLKTPLIVRYIVVDGIKDRSNLPLEHKGPVGDVIDNSPIGPPPEKFRKVVSL
jgi:hypothetical protein